MAVSTAGNVWLMTADNDSISGPVAFEEVKVVAGATGCTIELRQGAQDGTVLYSVVLGNNEEAHESLRLRTTSSVVLNVTAGGATVYLYSR
jgi:hypothetical protein